MPEPIKRMDALKSLSRDHHHGLLLCWKIRTGIKKNIEPQRIKTYVEWFWKSYLKHHFVIEENFVFPILGNDNELIKKAISEHRRLNRLFSSSDNISINLSLIEEELEAHIRFEERILFNEIQAHSTNEELQKTIQYHSDTKFSDNLTDPFWE